MKQENNAQEPVITDSEIKMPEEQFGATSTAEDEPSHLGAILGALIVVLVLLLGGLYLWGSTIQQAPPTETPAAVRPTPEENNEPESTTADAQVQALETVSTSDELDAIVADVESTNLDALDAELDTIDAELDTALQAI